MDLPFAIGLFVIALAVSYFTCLRPMRRGRGCCGMGTAADRMGDNRACEAGVGDDDTRRRAEIAQLLREIEALKAARR